MQISKLKFTLLLALFCGAAYPAMGQAPAKEQESKLIAVLQSNAEFIQKADACRELARIGTAECVPALAALLVDEKLTHMARYGLEPVPSPAVDEALRSALGKLKGRSLAGVIGSIGVRHDEKAVVALAVLIKDPDTEVAQAAARALGKIGNDAAAKFLGASSGTAGPNQLAVCEGLFRCAEGFAANHQPDSAIAIYDSLRKLNPVAHQVLAGAWRGAILTRQEKGLPLLLDLIRGTDLGLVAAAERIAIEMKVPALSKVLADELTKATPERQIMLCNVLGKRGDATAVPGLLGMAKAGDKASRVAAIRAAVEIGDSAVAVPLIGLLKDPEAEVAQAAAAAVAGLPGSGVDSSVIKMLDSADPALQAQMLEMARQRRITAAVPQIQKLMDCKNDAVKAAALRCYAELAGVSDISGLLDKLVVASDVAAIGALEKALASIFGAAAQPAGCVQQLVAALAKAGPDAKQAVLRTLRVAGGPEALAALRVAVGDANKDVHATAIRVLSDWKTVDAAAVLLELAKTAASPVDKILCLRGFLGMAARKDLPAPPRLAICNESAPLIQRPEEKLLLLGALSNLANAESLNLIVPYLDDPGVKREAVASVMSIAEKRAKKQHSAIAKAALEKVLVAAADQPAVVKRAQELLKQMESEK